MDWTGQETDRKSFLIARFLRRENRGGLFLDSLEGQIHRLKTSVAGAYRRSKRNEAEVPIELLLAAGAGDDCKIVAFGFAVLQDEPEEPAKNVAIAVFLLDRKQANLDDRPARRQIGIEVRQFLMK